MYNNRIARLRERLELPLLVTFLPNIRYLTGFTGSNAFVLVSDQRFVFITDGRYGEAAAALLESIDGGELVVYSTGLEDVLAAQMAGYGKVGLESQDVKWGFVHGLKAKVNCGLTPTSGIVEALRAVKDQTEIAALTAAAGAGDAAFSEVRALVDGSQSEGDVGWSLIDVMRRAGGRQANWPPIVAAGANAALPHHRSGTGALGAGLLLLDYGCTVDGYHSDMSRTIWLRGEPDSTTKRMHRAVLEAQEAGIAAVGPGVTGAEVDEACRAVLRGYDYEDLFVHSTGHGVGLEIHEAPRLAVTSQDELLPGHVVTIEPGVYVPGVGGVRIEDMVLVTEDGCRVLTQSEKGLEA
ncbi:MAG: Xaa-Pro peptidase family protein [Acidimicrobiia bacterium]|nr:Xaa-Pro peptidase family protein [Acidimicrobiia bacterium]